MDSTTNLSSAASTAPSMLLADFLHFCGQHLVSLSTSANVNLHTHQSLDLITTLFTHFLLARENRSHQARISSTTSSKLTCLGPHAILCDLFKTPTLFPELPLSRASTSPFLPVLSPSAFKYASGYSILKANQQTHQSPLHGLVLQICLPLSSCLWKAEPTLIASTLCSPIS